VLQGSLTPQQQQLLHYLQQQQQDAITAVQQATSQVSHSTRRFTLPLALYIRLSSVKMLKG